MRLMPYFWLAVGVAIVVAGLTIAFAKRRRDAPLRREVRAGSPVTFAADVAVRVRTLFGDVPLRGEMTLLIRGGFIEVSNPFPPARVLLGQEFYFRANDVQLAAGLSAWGGACITINGLSSGKQVILTITERKRIRAIWDALVGAGAAVPVGELPVS
jgi:hypothetical protein